MKGERRRRGREGRASGAPVLKSTDPYRAKKQKERHSERRETGHKLSREKEIRKNKSEKRSALK